MWYFCVLCGLSLASQETGLKSMISEVDLRRALGLAFQEFENRIEDVPWQILDIHGYPVAAKGKNMKKNHLDHSELFWLHATKAFQDSNRKCLSMFSKRALADLCISLLPYMVTLAWTGESELACLLLWLKIMIMIRPDWHSFCTSSLVLFWGEDVVELQTLITKKVNWAEYNAVLKKLADLRQYVDGMAESVFIGQREALESEFVSRPAFLHMFTPVERKTSQFLDHMAQIWSSIIAVLSSTWQRWLCHRLSFFLTCNYIYNYIYVPLPCGYKCTNVNMHIILQSTSV